MLKIQVITLCARTLNAISQKWTIFGISKSISSYSFRDKCLKPGSYVLETKTKLLIEPISDLGLRSENIEF